MRLYENLTDEALLALEERLYDEEVEGCDSWFERDQVLWEMNRREIGKRASHPEDQEHKERRTYAEGCALTESERRRWR